MSLASLYRHPFFTYTFVLSLLLAALLGVWRRFAAKKAGANPLLFVVSLAVPVLSYVVNYVLAGKTCGVGTAYSGAFAGFPSLHILCTINEGILGFVGPFSFLWLGFSIAFYWVRWYRARRLVRGFASISVDESRLRAALARLCGGLGLTMPRAFVVAGPEPLLLTAGVFGKTIVASTGALDLLEADELDAALAHELAHMRKGGHGLKWLFLLVRDLTMFSPASLWAYAGYRREEEKACDDWVASRTTLRVALASSLVKFMKRGKKSFFAEALSQLLPDGDLGATRVRRLLEDGGSGGGKRELAFLHPVLFSLVALGAFLFLC